MTGTIIEIKASIPEANVDVLTDVPHYMFIDN